MSFIGSFAYKKISLLIIFCTTLTHHFSGGWLFHNFSHRIVDSLLMPQQVNLLNPRLMSWV